MKGCFETVESSVADPERVDADPDPAFQAAGFGSKICFARERNIFQIFIYFFSIFLQNLTYIIFSVTMREEGLGVREDG